MDRRGQGREIQGQDTRDWPAGREEGREGRGWCPGDQVDHGAVPSWGLGVGFALRGLVRGL